MTAILCPHCGGPTKSGEMDGAPVRFCVAGIDNDGCGWHRTAIVVRCEASRLCDRQPCMHPAKYLAPANGRAVCGVHARAYLRCIPIAEFAPEGGREASRDGEH